MGSRRRALLSSSFTWIPAVLLLLAPKVAAVAVTGVRLVSASNRTDYVLQEEPATLYCDFDLTTDEVLTSVRWEREGKEVYSWRPGRRPIAKDVLLGRTDITNLQASFVVIRQAHMEMQGTYTCFVHSNQNTAQNDVVVTVIVDACKEDIWETHLYMDADTCTETISMHCVGVFPKPSPSCGVYNEATGRYLNSVPFERIVKLRNGTFEVSVNVRYNFREWTNFSDITFRCFLIVQGTSWKRGIRHRLFGHPGCPHTPPDVGPATYNISDELSCWGKKRDGATVTYTCNTGYTLTGSDTLTCRNGSWVPEVEDVTAEDVVADRSVSVKPYCNSAGKVPHYSLLRAIFATFPFFCMDFIWNTSDGW